MTGFRKKSIVVPVDFSGGSVEAIQTALDVAESPDQVHIVHVVMPLDQMSPGAIWGTIDDESRVDAVNSHFSDFLQQHGFHGLDPTVRIGDPGLKITELASEVKADLIVIPSHGYHGIKRVLLGSVTERVIRFADCPVLVLRRPDAS